MRPTKNPTRTLTIQLDAELLASIDAAIHRHGETLAAEAAERLNPWQLATMKSLRKGGGDYAANDYALRVTAYRRPPSRTQVLNALLRAALPSLDAVVGGAHEAQ